METKLEIVWDGSVPGLPDRRLSIDAFASSLKLLLSALRRIASAAERAATGEAYGTRGGRYSREAASLDLQLETLTANSPIHITAWVVQLDPPRPLIDDLVERAASDFVAAVREEASGRLYNASVRKFLQSLPDGLGLQRYSHTDRTGRKEEAAIGEVRLPEVRSLPYLAEFEGQLVGVGFAPADPVVRLWNGRNRFAATADVETIDRALGARNEPMKALAVVKSATERQVLRLDVASREWERPPADIRRRWLEARWHTLADRLAR